MRMTLIIFFLVCGAAQARACTLPRVDANEIHGLRSFSECLLAEIASLKRDQARLRREVEELQEALADIPGEFRNNNGRVTRLGGQRLVEASFAIDARTREGTAALAIDQAALEDLCAINCTITMSLIAEGLREADPAPAFALGPCAFHYGSENRAWARSGTCGDAISGIDGDGAPTGISGGEIIAEVGSACRLADSDPRLGVDPGARALGRDHAPGLFLIADPSLWEGDEARFRCELTLVR